MRWFRAVGWLVAMVAGAVALLVLAVFLNGSRAPARDAGEIVGGRRPEAAGESSQVLFGDLHVHTNFSTDAFVQALVVRQTEGFHPPADACDFARFCSGLDFWSINDHAEGLLPDQWRQTVESIRECNAVAGDPADPDMVSFLGWEWSQGGATPESHYGHKNVVLHGLGDDEIPARPIAAPRWNSQVWGVLGAVQSLLELENFGDYAAFHRYAVDLFASQNCPEGVDVRDLPDDCIEVAADPPALFEKLDQWGHRAVVIPHGLSWGTTNPSGADLRFQLEPGFHDPAWQPLIEVYSGHGNSEVYREFEPPSVDGDVVHCPEPSDGFTPCCWRARTLMRERCGDPTSEKCDEQVADAVRKAVGFQGILAPTDAVPGATAKDWGNCGQLEDAFLPAYNYRPKMSAQYSLAASGFDGTNLAQRFRMGFIASSDNHRSRPGTGYKEFGRTAMTDGIRPIFDGPDRESSLYYTGGLVAAHATGRDRDSIFAALERKQVYGTSGDRILLWFDLLNASSEPTRRPIRVPVRVPMGSEARVVDTPRFEVRAVGAREQLPGCPEYSRAGLPSERLAALCLGECYHPGDTRKRIDRIEVVRVRPQTDPDEPVRPLIEDPWRTFDCPDDPDGCRVSFEDPDFASSGRDAVYYVRAIQQASPAVNGDPLRCERDERGTCVRSQLCGLLPDGTPDDCLAPVEERAWSSPIFVGHAASP